MVVAVFPVARLRLQLQLWLWVHLVVLAIVDEVVAVDVAAAVGGVLIVDVVMAVAADAADQQLCFRSWWLWLWWGGCGSVAVTVVHP